MIIHGGVNTYPQNGCYPFDFSATNSNSLYHDSKVQPSAFQALIIIKVWSAAGCTVFKSLNTELELLAFIFTDVEPVAYEPLATRSKYSVPMLFEKTPSPCIWYEFWKLGKPPTFSVPVMFGNAQTRTSRGVRMLSALLAGKEFRSYDLRQECSKQKISVIRHQLVLLRLVMKPMRRLKSRQAMRMQFLKPANYSPLHFKL